MKLKTRNLNKLIEKLSGREIDLLLYLVKRQSNIGCVDGIHYKDVMDDLHMPKSTFYAVIQELQLKDFIYLKDLDNSVGFNIFIYDNSFLTKGDFKEGYVNINFDFILSKEFILLNVNLKKFFLRLLGLQANNKPVRLLKDTLKRYKVNKFMTELDKLFDIIIDDSIFVFIIKPSLLKSSCSGEYLQYELKLENYCEDYKLDYTEEEMRDTVKSIINHIRKGRFALIQKALDAIRRIGRLQPKLVNHICKVSY